MELNNCLNSPTCTSMTEHLRGSGSPAEGLSSVAEVFVIEPEYAIVVGSCRSSKAELPESLSVTMREQTQSYKLIGLCASELLVCQSAGGDSIPHTLPGSSKVRPRIQNFSYFSGLIQFTTRAVTLCLTGSPSNRIAVPISRGRPKRAAHPWGFTRRVTPGSENGLTGSRLVMVSGIWRLILVPRRGSGKNLCSG